MLLLFIYYFVLYIFIADKLRLCTRILEVLFHYIFYYHLTFRIYV